MRILGASRVCRGGGSYAEICVGIARSRPACAAVDVWVQRPVTTPAASPQLSSASRPAASGAAQTLYVEPAQGFGFAYTLVNQAKTSVDMTMYELVDTTFSADLVAACKRGVKVRVILDQNLERSQNAAAFTQINAQPNCSAVYANPAFQATHEKALVIDGTTLVLMTANLTSRSYSTTRDFALVENDLADIAAMEATFNADFNSTTSFSYQPGAGDNLIWSPTTAQADLLGIINGASKTLLVENEEMGAATSSLHLRQRANVASQSRSP